MEKFGSEVIEFDLLRYHSFTKPYQNKLAVTNHKNRTEMSNTKIPGLSFSWKRALGVTKAKRQFTKATGIPTTKAGIERKVGAALINLIFKPKR